MISAWIWACDVAGKWKQMRSCLHDTRGARYTGPICINILTTNIRSNVAPLCFDVKCGIISSLLLLSMSLMLCSQTHYTFYGQVK